MDGFFVTILILGILLILMPIITFCIKAKQRKRYQGTIISPPVVVVSEQHQTAGGYPVTVQHHNANMTQAHVQPGMPGAYPMPQPGSMSMPPNYNQFGGAQVPYPTNTPYPMGMPQPGVMPMPPQHQNPPSYNEVVGNEAYQKQAPFNPNFSS